LTETTRGKKKTKLVNKNKGKKQEVKDITAF